MADCNVPEKLIEVGSCETASECVHHTLCRVREELNRHNLRSEGDEKEGWAYEAAICIFSDARLAVPGNIQPVCSDYRHIGRNPNPIQFISTYKGDLILM